MKKLSFILIASIFLALVFSAPVSAASDKVSNAVQGTPVIDGEYEALWDLSEWSVIAVPHTGVDRTDVIAKFKTLWDNDAIYFYVDITCPADIDVDELFLEMFLDEGKHFKDYFDEVDWGAAAFGEADDRQTVVGVDNREPAGYGLLAYDEKEHGRGELTNYVAKKTGAGCVFEIAMKFDTIKGAVGGGIAVDIMLNGAPDAVFLWSTDQTGSDGYTGYLSAHGSSARFGTVNFVAAPAPEPEPEAPAADVPAEAPPADDSASAPVASAPKVGDTAMIFFGCLIVLSVAVMVLRKKANVSK